MMSLLAHGMVVWGYLTNEACDNLSWAILSSRDEYPFFNMKAVNNEAL